MLRSLFTGVSGLRTHQTMLDVTGNNIANVNTTGFKGSQVQFVDTLSQLTKGAGAPVPPAQNKGAMGGTNPTQVGLGVELAGITTNFVTGSTQLTGRPTDLKINGDGFFVVQDGNNQLYTRAGSFSKDRNDVLVAPNGAKLLGIKAEGVVNYEAYETLLGTPDPNSRIPTLANTANGDNEIYGPIQLPPTYPKSNAMAAVPAAAGPPPQAAKPAIPAVEEGKLEKFDIAPDGIVTAWYDNGQKIIAGKIAIAAFNNPAGLVKQGNSNYAPSNNSGEPLLDAAGEGPRGRLSVGTLEMSNVDLAQEFTSMIIAQRGLQANSRTITTSDEVLQELINLKR